MKPIDYGRVTSWILLCQPSQKEPKTISFSTYFLSLSGINTNTNTFICNTSTLIYPPSFSSESIHCIYFRLFPMRTKHLFWMSLVIGIATKVISLSKDSILITISRFWSHWGTLRRIWLIHICRYPSFQNLIQVICSLQDYHPNLEILQTMKGCLWGMIKNTVNIFLKKSLQ